MENPKLTWITLFPDWYRRERESLAEHYPSLVVDRRALRRGVLRYHGKLAVHPSGGTVEHPIKLLYPDATPYAPPVVTPLYKLPTLDENGRPKTDASPRLFDHRHQMPWGGLCLFQSNPRSALGPEAIRGIDVLARAERWFLGHHTGHWPPDTADSELETHFQPVYDILIGQSFYETEISGQGRFYAVPAFGRVQDAKHRFILTSITSEGKGIVIPKDARRSLGNTFPQIQSAAWNLGNLSEAEQEESIKQLIAKYCWFRGYWWDLASEPVPFHNGLGLLKVLGKTESGEDGWELLKRALGSGLLTDEVQWVGLRYPARQGGLEWLIVSVLVSCHRGPGGGILLLTDRQQRECFEKAKIYGVRAHSCKPEDLRRRNTSVISHDITDKTVALVGLGALGSVVADLLAKAGVGHFRLCDYDRLSPGNVARHVGGLSDFGVHKTRVVRTRLFEINPYLSLSDEDILTDSAVSSLEGLRKFLKPADLVVSTMADEGAEAILNQIAVDMGKPVVYARALRRGKVGRVFIVRPCEDACKSCIAIYARSETVGERTPEDWISVKELDEDILEHECGRPVIPGSAVDMSFIASLCARVALDYLEGTPLKANHWMWAAVPSSDIDDRLNAEMQVLPLRLCPSYDCLVCREPPIERLLLAESVRTDIIAMAEKSLNVETCGVLVGYVDDQRRAIALRAVGPGPQAQRSSSMCSRDSQFAQQHLETAAVELGERGQYLGEWHSHFETKPQPSPIDISSLFGIARAPNYLNRCPVMIIAGLDAVGSGKVQNLHVSIYPINGRSHTIPYEIISNEKALTFSVGNQLT